MAIKMGKSLNGTSQRSSNRFHTAEEEAFLAQ